MLPKRSSVTWLLQESAMILVYQTDMENYRQTKMLMDWIMKAHQAKGITRKKVQQMVEFAGKICNWVRRLGKVNFACAFAYID